MTKPSLSSQRSLDVEDYIDSYDEDLPYYESVNNPNDKPLNSVKEEVKMREKGSDVESNSIRKAPTMIIESIQIGRPLKVLSLLVNVLALIFFFLSTSGSNWLLTTNLRVGLWEECVYNVTIGVKSCNRNPCFKGYVNIFVVCCVFALLMTLVSSSLLGLGMRQTVIRRKLNMYNAVVIINIIAMFLFLIAIIGYPIQFIRESDIISRIHEHGEFWGFGWSYIMGCLGVVAAAIATGLLHYDKSSEEIIYYEKISRNSCSHFS